MAHRPEPFASEMFYREVDRGQARLDPRAAARVPIALGKALRAARVERGYGQEGFAAHAGLTRSYYGAIERGEFNVSLETTLKLSSALELSAAGLLRRAGL